MNYLGIFLGLILFLFSACENKQKNDLSSTENAVPEELRPTETERPRIQFKTSKVFFGNIKEGDTLHYTYKFKNIGNKAMKIISVNASCGCTTPEWTSDLIPPGGQGSIKIMFDSKGRRGLNSKTITVYANTIPMDTQVSFRVNVL